MRFDTMEKIQGNREISACLETVLQQLDITPETSNVPQHDDGLNYTGTIKRVYVRGKDKFNKEVVMHFLVKISSRSSTLRSLLMIEQAYQCEIFMYNTVFPLFTNMQKESMIAEPFESYPKFFAAFNNSFKETLVLEDLIQYKVVNPQATLTYGQASNLAKEIGKLHAMSLALRKRNPKLLEKISNSIRNETRDNDKLQELRTSFLKSWASKYINLLDPEKDKVVWKKFTASFPERVETFYDRHNSVDYNDEHGVIGHCDLWACNLLFNSREEVRILDWQTARICSPAVDLSDILFACCDSNVRRQYGGDLIKTYYNSCITHLTRLGEDGGRLFPYSVLKRHLHEYSGYSFYSSIRLIGLISVAEIDAPNLLLAKNIEDIIDMYRLINVEPKSFNQRVRDLIIDFVGYGYDF